MSEKTSYQLTKYPIGSIREIWTISWPLMIGLLGSSLMVFIDRILLARFSIEAMNASATGGTGFYAFIILPSIIASISEVFVGQYHGQGNFAKMGSAVWQMIWFSLLLTPIFFLLAWLGPKFLFSRIACGPFEGQYFAILIFCGPLFCMLPALFGFFAGQGKVYIIAWVTLIGNVINFLLDLVLIFGWKSFIPAMGIEGAAYSTVTATAFQVFFMMWIFLKKNKCFEKNSKWDFGLLKNCLKIGFPASLAHTSEFFSHFVFFILMNLAGPEYLTISVVLQTFYILIFFVVEGLSKGVTAISSNLIGAKKYQLIGKNLISTFFLHVLFFVAIFFVFFKFSPKIFTPFFFEKNVFLFQDPIFLMRLYNASIWLALFLLFDGWAWALIGVLTGAGDTKFIMRVGILAPWLFNLLPTWILLSYFHVSVDQLWLCFVLYAFMILLVYFMRYRSKKWIKQSINS